MSLIVVIAHDTMPAAVSWSEYSFTGRGFVVPARVRNEFCDALAPWRDRVEPVVLGGEVVGLRVSSRVTPRAAYRLKDLVLPFLAPLSHESETVEDDGHCDLSLEEHGLHIPERHVERAKATLLQLGDLHIRLDENANIVALRIPVEVRLASVFAALEIDVVPIEPANGSRRRQLLEALGHEIERIERGRARPRRTVRP